MNLKKIRVWTYPRLPSLFLLWLEKPLAMVLLMLFCPTLRGLAPVQISICGTSRWPSGWESTWQYRGHRFAPWPEKISCVAGQLRPCATTPEPVLWNQRRCHSEKPAHCNQEEKQLEKSCQQQQRCGAAKKKLIFKILCVIVQAWPQAIIRLCLAGLMGGVGEGLLLSQSGAEVGGQSLNCNSCRKLGISAILA